VTFWYVMLHSSMLCYILVHSGTFRSYREYPVSASSVPDIGGDYGILK